MANSINQDAAIRLAELDLPVFPCINDPGNEERHKKPIGKDDWRHTPSRPAWQVAAVWSANPSALPAIPAKVIGVVIDCDRKHGKDGVTAFTTLCAAHSIDLSNAFVVETPSTGLHFYWRTEALYGNSCGSLPDGIDVRGIGGYVIGPGATLPDGRAYRIVQGDWSAIPALPESLAALLRPKVDSSLPIPAQEPVAATERERAYAENALTDEVEKLSVMQEGEGRNAALNGAAKRLGEMVRAGWIERNTVEQALWEASERNGYRAKDGDRAAWATLCSGLNAGIESPRSPLPVLDIPQWIPAMLASWIEAYKAKHSSATIHQSGKRSVSIIQCSSIQTKPVTFLWEGFIPQGKLTLLAGAGGTGKSTLAFNFAATVSNGGTWADGSHCAVPGNVLIWSSEDDQSDTITPRLMAVGADLLRCGIVNSTIDEKGERCPFDAARDMDGLREAIQRIGGVSLLIIDPIVTAVTGDMHKANDVRRSLQSIVDFATETNCAVLGITHFAKDTVGKNSAERVIGSQAFAALARMVLVAAKEEESQRRVFTRAKSNNSIDTGGFEYFIEAVELKPGMVATRVRWGEALEGSSRSILAKVEGDGREDGEKMRAAKQFLIDALSNGPGPSKEIAKHARDGYGISEDTLRRAYREIGVKPYRVGFGSNGTWMWALPIVAPSH